MSPRDPAERKQAAYRVELEQRKRQSVLQLLFKAARLYDERAIARAPKPEAAPVLGRAHTSLLPYIDLEGTRLVELARRVGVSKQAIGQLVDDLEAAGTCERVPDPNDRRAKLVRFSARGKQQLLDGLALLRDMERELEAALGARALRSLRSTLARLIELVEGDATRRSR